jgi:hypothetical protein
VIRARKTKYGSLIVLAVNLFSFFVLTCGIDEYYYLPQVSQSRIRDKVMNNSATIDIPSISDFYYATNYSIFYRIYISGQNVDAQIQTSNDILSNINPDLWRDYSAIYPSTDPTNSSASTSVSTLFKNRNYFELELFNVTNIYDTVLSPNGGKLTLQFPAVIGEYPYATFNNESNLLLKRCSRDLISPVPDLYFLNSEDLNDSAKAIATINADVAGRTGISQRYAYVSMYIVAVGLNPGLFTPIYSKPTHIGIFKLPEKN